MWGRSCCVKKCHRRSHDYRGRRIPNGLTFYCFPAWRRNEGGQTSELTKRRRKAWVAAVARNNITFNHIPTAMRVCSRHFHSGKPVYEMLESDPDWAPSLHLGHSDGDSSQMEEAERQTETQRATSQKRPSPVSSHPPRESDAAEGPARLAVHPCRDITSLLQSVQIQTDINKQPGDETGVSFRDFFRGSLEASLEASSRTRALSARQASSYSSEFKVQLDFKLLALREENQTSEASSPCLNCVQLQGTITELQDKLTRLTGELEDSSTPRQPIQDLHSLESLHIDVAVPEWTEPVSPLQLADTDGVQDLDPAPWRQRRGGSSTEMKPRKTPCFKKAWLKRFWFLRYSSTLDQMWCHVCRLHADKSHQHLALIKGSRMFKAHNIEQHGISKYHQDNVERYRLSLT